MQIERPVERRVAAADDDEVLPGELRRLLDAIEDLRLRELVDALDLPSRVFPLKLYDVL